jgi:hypothetical protein
MSGPLLRLFFMDRATAIRKSLSAFVWGLIGVLPVVGLIPAVCALGHWWAVRSDYKDEWNPAYLYHTAGAGLAVLGLLSTTLLGAALVIALCGDFF